MVVWEAQHEAGAVVSVFEAWPQKAMRFHRAGVRMPILGEKGRTGQTLLSKSSARGKVTL